MAVSVRQEDAVVAGKYRKDDNFVCGIFDLKLSDGSVRPVQVTEACDDSVTPTDISLSPDSKRAVAIHKRALEIIDMGNGRSRNIGDGFQAAAWSPDGRWIAAALYSSLDARMTLFDANTLAAQRTLVSSTVFRISWSPDSRFLLAWKLLAGCGPDEYSYEIFDTETGKSSIIESSMCKVRGNDVGWVNKVIAAE
jgi:WD40 repeat protein